MALTTQLLLLPILIAANAFFVSGEYVTVAIRRPQISAMYDSGWRRTAGYLQRLRANIASTIGGIQVCITMTNLVLGWLGEPAMTAVIYRALTPMGWVLSPATTTAISIVLAFTLVTVATVILSELLPKALTLQHLFLVAKLVAGPLLLILIVIRPLVWLMDRTANLLSRLLGLGPIRIEETPPGIEELKAITQDAELGHQERALILNTLGLSDLRADDVMVPRVKVASLDLQRTMEANREVMEERLFSRLPLCNGGMDHIVGIIYTKEFLAAYPETNDSSVLQLLARPAIFAPATISVDRLLSLFMEKHSRMIILVDEYGGVDGIATLTDVMDRLLKGERDDHKA